MSFGRALTGAGCDVADEMYRACATGFAEDSMLARTLSFIGRKSPTAYSWCEVEFTFRLTIAVEVDPGHLGALVPVVHTHDDMMIVAVFASAAVARPLEKLIVSKDDGQAFS